MRGPNLSQILYRMVSSPCVLVFTLLALGSPAANPTTQPLIHVPDEPSQAKAQRMVREVFAKDYPAQTPPQRVTLAKKMIQQAIDTADDPAAICSPARGPRPSSSAGDSATTQRAIRLMGQWYAIDQLKMLVVSMGAAHAAATSPESQLAIAQACMAAVDQAVVVDDYSTATRLLTLAESAATSAKNVALASHLKERAKRSEAATRRRGGGGGGGGGRNEERNETERGRRSDDDDDDDEEEGTRTTTKTAMFDDGEMMTSMGTCGDIDDGVVEA